MNFRTFQGGTIYEIFITNTTVESFQGTTTRGSGLMKELNENWFLIFKKSIPEPVRNRFYLFPILQCQTWSANYCVD